MDATKVDTQIMELQAQGESFSRAMDMEFQREAQLTQEIKDVREEVMELRRSCKLIKCYDHLSGGVNASKETNANIEKEIRLLENRLNKMLIRHSEAVAANRRLKESVNYKRQRRLIMDGIYNKIKNQLLERKRELESLMEQANEVNAEREKALEEERLCRQLAAEDTEVFQRKFKELGLYLERHRKEEKERLAAMAKPQFSNTVTKGAKRGGPLRKGSAGAGSSEEDESMESQLLEMQKGSKAAEKKAGEQAKTIRTYEEAFRQLREATGIDDVDTLVTTFIANEEETFSLFAYIQNINQEVDKTESKVDSLKTEMQRYQEEQGARQTQRKAALAKLKEKLVRLREKEEAAKREYVSAKSTIEQISKTVQAIFFKIGCDQMQGVRDSMKSGGSKPAGGKGAAAADAGGLGMTLEMSMLSGQDITDANIMQYMGIIEQRAMEVCADYARYAARNGESLSATGPSVPARITAGAAVVPPSVVPSFEDFSDEEGGGGDEGKDDRDAPQRLLTLDEMRRQASASVSKIRERESAPREKESVQRGGGRRASRLGH